MDLGGECSRMDLGGGCSAMDLGNAQDLLAEILGNLHVRKLNQLFARAVLAIIGCPIFTMAPEVIDE